MSLTDPAVRERFAMLPRQLEVEGHIDLLKRVRKAVLELRVLTDQYSHSLSCEFLEPLHKTESALSALLLERELWSGES